MTKKLLAYAFITSLISLLFLTGTVAASSNVDGDAWSDVVALYNYGNADTSAWFLKSNGTNVVPTLAWSSGVGNWDWSRSKIVTGNFTADTNADIFVLYDYGNDDSAGWILRSDGTHVVPTLAWSSGVGNWDWNRSKIAAGNFDADAFEEVYVLYDYGNSASALWIFDSDGMKMAPRLVWASGPGNWDWNRSKLAVTNFDGAGYDDLMVLYDYGNDDTGAWAMESNGTTVTTVPVWRSGPGNWSWSRSKMVAGDFSGDTHGDLAILYDYGNGGSGLWFLTSSGSSLSTQSAWASGGGNWDWNRSRPTSGNFTGDAHDDVAILYDYDNGGTNVWLMGSNGATATPSVAWGSGAGNWDSQRTKVANAPTFIPRCLGAQGDKWIDINLSIQLLTCYQDILYELNEGVVTSVRGPVFSTLVSSGRSPFDTPTGNYAVYAKDVTTDMSGFGGTAEYYYVPNVPYVLWFNGNYSIHGAYWHNDFGNVRSHGCVNLPVDASAWVYSWAPVGTPVSVHY